MAGARRRPTAWRLQEDRRSLSRDGPSPATRRSNAHSDCSRVHPTPRCATRRDGSLSPPARQTQHHRRDHPPR